MFSDCGETLPAEINGRNEQRRFQLAQAMKKSLELRFGEVSELYFVAVRTAASELKFPQNAFYSLPVRLWNRISSYNVPASYYWR